MIIEKSKIKALLEVYEDVLRKMHAAGETEEDRDTAYIRYCGAVWAFQTLGVFDYDGAIVWINRFAHAVDGVEYKERVTA